MLLLLLPAAFSCCLRCAERCRSIAKNYSHIKNVEAQLAQLQLQLNLTSGPKKSALEMLRKKIEAKNEQVVAARQKFMSAQKVS